MPAALLHSGVGIMAGTAEFFGVRGTASALAARIVLAVACAGMVGAAAALGSGGATAGIGQTAAGAASFADRFAAAAARPDCAGGTWPYFEAGCLRRRDGTGLRPVRLIAIDRQIPGR
jgi:hypothetical protein